MVVVGAGCVCVGGGGGGWRGEVIIKKKSFWMD